MEKVQGVIRELHYDNGTLNSEEQVWFPTILHYLQKCGIGNGKHGKLLKSNAVRIENFLPQEDLAALLAYTLKHKADFRPSHIIGGRKESMTNVEQYYKETMSNRIDNVLPDVLHTLGIEPFFCAIKEYQIAASNDEEFFKLHKDANAANIKTRKRVLTYVYYFHSEPRAFSGGDLRVYDTITVDNFAMAALNFQTITPQQNMAVFFPSGLLHEVLPVYCPSQQFAGSRFTFNGFLQAPEESN